MSTRDDPGEQLLDLLVYAPLGLLLEAKDLLPRLARKGRERMGGQVTVARMIGEVAVRQGQRRAEAALRRLREQQGAARTPAADTPPSNGHGPSPAAPTPAATGPTPDAAALAIPGYDTLSASQVVPRLEGLSLAELDAVRAYEAATRARKTVLTRIDQLRGA